MSEYVFTEAQFSECHASTLVALKDGRVLVSWFGGTKEGNNDVAIWLAEKHRNRWSSPRVVAKVRDEPHWNPVLFRAGATIFLFFKVGKTISGWETWVIQSNDDGLTWSPPRELVPEDRGGRGPVKNKPIILSNGDWIAPASIERDVQGEKIWDAFVDISRDEGATWTRSDAVGIDHNTFDGEGIIQPTLWESRPGEVHMFLRSSCGSVCRSDSSDYGNTWSDVYETEIPNNNSGLDLAKLDDGTLALVHNPVRGNWAARTPLRCAFSYDNGETWPDYVDLETDEGEYSYPAVIPVEGGMAITYTWKRKRIAFRKEVVGTRTTSIMH